MNMKHQLKRIITKIKGSILTPKNQIKIKTQQNTPQDS